MARAVFVVRSNSRRFRRSKSHKVRSNRRRVAYPRRVTFRKARANGRRRNGVSVLRANGLGIKRNGIAVRKNGVSVLRANGHRRNGIGLRSNPYSRRRNGIIGGIAALAMPAVAGALSLGVVHFALGYADMIPGDPLSYVEPVAYTVGGLGASLIVGLLPIPLAYKAMFGGAAVIGGAAVDAFRFLAGPSGMSPVPVTRWGDGGMWALGSTPRQLGMSMGPQGIRQGAMAGWVHAQR